MMMMKSLIQRYVSTPKDAHCAGPMQPLAHGHYSILGCMLCMYLYPALITHLPSVSGYFKSKHDFCACVLRLDLGFYSHLKEQEIEVKSLSHSKQGTDQGQDGYSNSHLLAELTFSPAGKLKVSILTPRPQTPQQFCCASSLEEICSDDLEVVLSCIQMQMMEQHLVDLTLRST